jgi:hypothetical protein
MKVTRDVILDLWPVYESGAASEDTRRLVDAFLDQDPEFARAIREGEEKMSQTLAAVPVLPHPDAERAALARTQLLLRLRYYFLALACFLTVSATILRQYRRFSLAMALVSGAAWVVVWSMARSPRIAGLLPAPRVETPSQARWRSLRAACVGLALVATLFSAVLAPRLRVFAIGAAVLGVLGWLGVGIAGRMRER